MIETKDYENPWPNETIPNECSEEEALMHTLDQVASTWLQALFREFNFRYSKATLYSLSTFYSI